MTNEPAKISISAIFIGMVVGIGFLMIFAALGGALALSIGFEEKKLFHLSVLIPVAIIKIFILTFVFFVASFIAAKLVNRSNLFIGLVHTLATWAIMSTLMVVLLMSATAANKVAIGVSQFKPVIVTDLEIFKGKAITTMEKGPEKAHPQEKKHEKIIALAWWMLFVSLLLGLGASIFAGFKAKI